MINTELLIKAANELANRERDGFDHAEIFIQDIGDYKMKIILENKTGVNVLELLSKYLRHIVGCEGISYIGTHHRSGVIFTFEEMKLLKDLE